MSLYLGVDLGTQSVKVVVLDAADESIVARGQAALPETASPRAGAAEQDPRDWWIAFQAAMEQALATPGLDRKAFAAIGVSGQQHGMVALDREDQVLRPAKLWCDVEAEAEASECRQLLGLPTPAGYTAPKILWFLRKEPEHAARLHRIALPHDWLNFRLTGNWATEAGDASGTGLFDPIVGAYREEARNLDPRLPDCLLPVQASHAEHGRLLPSVAEAFGLPTGMRVSMGSGDNMMSALGAGATEEGTWVFSLGTSGTLFGHSQQAILDPTGSIAPFRDATGGGLPLVCTQNCSTVVEEVRRPSGLSHAELTSRAESLVPHLEEPMFLPYLRGERTPDWPHARGVLHGLGPGDLAPEILYRAAIEGASLALLHGLDLLRERDSPVSRLRLVGGGSRNPLWARLLCDAAQQPIEVMAETETAAVGAAVQARWMAEGLHPRDNRAAKVSEALEPNPALAEHYRSRLQRYRELGAQLFAKP